MKILRITAQGLPLFKKDLDICFYTQQRVCEEDKDSLYRLTDNYYLHSACQPAFLYECECASIYRRYSIGGNCISRSDH